MTSTRIPATRENLRVGSVVYRGKGKVAYTVTEIPETWLTHVALSTNTMCRISSLTVEA